MRSAGGQRRRSYSSCGGLLADEDAEAQAGLPKTDSGLGETNEWGFLVMQRRHRRHDCHRERRSMEKQPTLTSNGLSSLSLSAPYTRFRSVVECLMLLLGQLGAGALACAEKNSPEREVNEWLAAPLGR